MTIRDCNTHTVRGAVNPGLLSKADRLFRNDDPGIWIELLQNSRRAGATLIEIAIKEITSPSRRCEITVIDNGKGIEEFQALLTLGESGWGPDLQASEDPAGMGFYSLCRSGEVEVSSGHRRVTITPAVFLGQAEAQVETSDDSVAGTRIRYARECSKNALTAALIQVSEFCPVEVRLDGKELPRHDFLEGALHREVIDGIEVGFAIEFKWQAGYLDSNWNFYGSRIREAFQEFTGLFNPAKPETPLTIYARFNVLETGRVSLQLPDRRAIIQSPFFHEFIKKTQTAVYRFFQKQGQHLLPFKNWLEAKRLGVSLPEAVCVLAPWFVEPQDDGLEPLFGRRPEQLLLDVSNVMLLDRDLTNAHSLEAVLHSGAVLEGLSLFRADYSYEGYSWYGKLPRIAETTVFLDDVAYEDWPTRKERPSKIEIEITITQAGQPDTKLRLPALIHVATEDVNLLDFVAVHDSPWDNERLDGPFSVTDFLMGATFQASDDIESDSWETQQHAYEGDVCREVNAYFRGPEASLRAILSGLIDYDANRLAEQLCVGEIRLKRTGPAPSDWAVELERRDRPWVSGPPAIQGPPTSLL